MTCRICRDLGCSECLPRGDEGDRIVIPVAAMSFDGLIARAIRNDEQEWKERFFHKVNPEVM